jgi:cytochrome c oxidase assembly factor 6
MGFFSSTNSPPAPKISADGTPIAPNRTERAKCWEGRDGYFRCLDKNNIIDAVKDEKLAEEKCAPESREFERTCATSWVSGCR